MSTLPSRRHFLLGAAAALSVPAAVAQRKRPNILFVIADLQRMWLTLHVRQEDARHVRAKQAVRFRPDKESPEVVGEVGWISPTVDERTRAIAERVAREARARSGPDATFEQRREAAARVMSEVLCELRAEEEARGAGSSKEGK